MKIIITHSFSEFSSKLRNLARFCFKLDSSASDFRDILLGYVSNVRYNDTKI